jgi:hypothetical protein
VHETLVGLGRAVGRLHGLADPKSLHLIETETDNLRHWLSRSEGTDRGLELAMALARAWQELGLGGDGAAWLRRQVASAPEHDPGAAAARIAAGLIRGWIDVAPEDVEWLRPALDAVAAAGDWEMWLHGSVLATLALGRAGGDLYEALELITGERAQIALGAVADPWFTIQRQAVLAIGPVGAGNFTEARAYLDRVVDAYLELGDRSSALEHLAIKTTFARIIQAWDDLEADLERAAPLLEAGLARGAAALIGVERTHLLRGRGHGAAASRAMADAIEALERAGGQRHVASRRVELAGWLQEEGRTAEALTQVRAALPTLLRHDRLGAAMGLAVLIPLVDGETSALLAGATRRRQSERGLVDLTEERREEMQRLLAAATQGREAAEARGAAMDDDELVELVESIELR